MQEPDSNKKCIVVIGDIMLDEYVFGTVNKVSPESCCPVLLSQHLSYQLGGAANVAFQISELDRKVILVGIIGTDTSADILLENISNKSIDSSLIFRHDSVTTQKTRYVNDLHQQMFRVDREERSCLDSKELNLIISFLRNYAESIECIILSDYNKGVLTTTICQTIINWANKTGIPTIVDIKIPDIKRYQNATVVKGNHKEFSAFFPFAETNTESIESNMHILRSELKSKHIAVTLGKCGISGIGSQGEFIHHKANQVLVYDVTGAGDIVTAYIGVLFNKMPFSEVLFMANKAAGIKVTRFGNSSIKLDEVSPSKSKIKDVFEIRSLSMGKTVVFTNGCFDIFHAGHADLLHFAKSKGDILVVGVNTDESVKRLKGDNRPINKLEMRIKVLSSISDVDFIIPFDDDTPERLITELHPDYLIKGGDYTPDSIVGANHVIGYGGKVETMPFHYSQSTTNILSCL